MNPKTFHMISLGCAKNTVDTSAMTQLMNGSGYQFSDKPEKAAILIVNTCGFIGPAKAESLEVLGELASHKRKDQLLIAAGCLTQRYGMEVARQVPGIDGILGTRNWMEIVDLVQTLREDTSPLGDVAQNTRNDSSPRRINQPQPLYHLPGDAPEQRMLKQQARLVAIQGASAYLKIADGCRRPCAFCAIPLIKGGLVSRPLETILEEALFLQEQGLRELILIAQDTTDYGHDLGMQDGLAILLEKICAAVPAMDWIRVMYAYPGYVTDRLIDVIASQPKILPYLDMPLQHAHPNVLQRMRRPANLDWVYSTLQKMRQAIPNLALRSTFIVGYPGETEAEFQTLLDFIEEIRFDRLGAFQFSFEPGTTSEPLGDPIPAEVKQERYERLMERQTSISLQKNQALVGSMLDVLIEGYGGGRKKSAGLSLGRSYRDAPEIDGLVIVEGRLPVGQIVPVRITGAMTYDLTGVDENTRNQSRQ